MTDLFERTNIGGIDVKNHFIRSATYEGKANEDGSPSKDIFEIYRQLAKGNVGTIITSYTYVADYEKPALNQLGIYADWLTEKYKPLTEEMHSYGTKIVMQIVHGSSFKQADPQNARIIGPSAVKHPDSGIIPYEMEKDDINNMINLFANAAERVKAAGFDGVQIHVAHGYQLSQWISPLLNKRNDKYGGSPLNRFRIVGEIYEEVRRRVGTDFPIWMKINSSDEVDGGLTVDEFIEMGMEADRLGFDAIEVSGNKWRMHDKEERAYYKDAATRLAERVKTPIILTGGLRELSGMEEIAKESKVKFFGIARPLMKEPNFVKNLK